MDSRVAFGSHSHIAQPIGILLKECQNLNEKYHNSPDPNIQFLLSYIPLIDAIKLESFLTDIQASNFKVKLKQNGYNYNLIDSTFFTKYPFLSEYTDIQYSLIFLYCICTFIIPSADHDNFNIFLSLLSKTISSQLTIVRNFCFEIILSNILSATKQQDYYEDVLKYILSTTSIAPTSYPLLITLFKLVAKGGSKTEILLSREVIAHMFECDFSFIQDIEVSSLIEPLLDDIMNFDRNSLQVLGSATKKGKVSRSTMQIIHNMYNKFILFIEINSTSDPLLESNLNSIFRISEKAKIPNHNYQFYDRPEFHFLTPKLESVSQTKKLPIMVSEKISQLSIAVTDFLIYASKEIFVDFLGQFPIFLQKKKYFLDTLCALLSISKKLLTPQSITTFIHIINQTQLFSSSQNAFEPENFDPRINYFRNEIFDLIASVSPERVSLLFDFSQHEPFLLNEHFMRVLLRFDSFPHTVFTNYSNRTIFANSMLDLQACNRPGIELVRSVNFYFISAILRDKSISNTLFSSSLFVSSFLQFVFEPGLLDYTMDTFTRSMALTNSNQYKDLKTSVIINFFQNVISSCAEKAQNAKYQKLYQKVSNSILLAMRYNSDSTQNFGILLNSFLDYAKASPSVESVIKCLDFIQINMMTFDSWELSPHQYSMIFSSVRYICTDEPNERIVKCLFSILQKSSFMTPNANNFLIHCPSILPLILVIHGKSKKNSEILSIFIELCKYSKQNSVAMHEGYIDHLLIQFLKQNEDHCFVNFRDKTIEFFFDRKNSLNLILELLQQIVLTKATFSTAFNLISLLESTNNETFYKFVSNLLINGLSWNQLFTNIPLDSSTPSIQINGVDWNSFKNMFTITFKLNLDEPISKHSKICYTIFEATDEINKFSIVLKNGAISANFITPTSTSTTYLFRNIFASEWSQFSIVSNVNKDKNKFYNFLNKERMADSTISPIFFEKNTVTIRIGGSDFKFYSQMKHPCFGKMYGFSFYPKCLNDDDINMIYDSPESFKKCPLFSTNDIQSETNKIIRYNSITMTLLPVFHRVMHILDFFCEPLLFEKIINLKNLSYGLDFLYYSFLKHPEIQPFFSLVCQLAEITKKNPKYSTYLSLYRFLDIIESHDLQMQWFEKIIMNFSVWVNSDDLYEIILHWSINFSVHKSFYLEKNFFSLLLSQFITLFLVRKSEESKQRSKIIDLLYKFLLKLAKVKFTKQNFDVLLHYIFDCKSKSNLKDLIEILFTVSTYDVVIQSIDEEKLSLLHRVFKVKDTDILVKMTLCIDNLRVKIPNYSMLSISYFILDFSGIVSFVDQLIEKLDNYPNILSLLTILSIHTNKCEDLVKKIDSNMKSDKPTLFSIINTNFWYVWPILLILNIPKKSCETISKLIATCLSLTKGSDQIDQVFAMMFRMSFFIPEYDMIGELLKNLCSFYEETNVPIPDDIAEYFFIFFFIHIPQELHSGPLLNLFEHSMYPKMQTHRSNSAIYNKISIIEFEELLNDGFLKFDPQCRVSIDDEGKVLHTHYYKIYQAFNAQKKLKFDKRLMEYFIERDNIDQQTQFQMAQNLTSTMDSFKISAINDLVATLIKIQKGILILITKSKEIVNNSSTPRKKMARSSTNVPGSHSSLDQHHQEQIKEQKKIQAFVSKEDEINSNLSPVQQQKNRAKTLKTSLSASVIHKVQKVTPGIILRANVFCASFCPFRIRTKHTKTNEMISQPPNLDISKIPGTLIRTFYCSIINLDKSTKYKFHIYNDKFIFANKNHLKIIPFEKVRLLFDRKFANNNGYEIYLYNRKSYLFIFQPTEYQEVTSILKTIRFTEAEKVIFSSDSYQIDLTDLTNQWMTRRISNFKYLMILNILSDHSFKNELIYPVMPPVLSDLNNLKSTPNFLHFDRNSFRKVSLTPVISIKEVFVEQLFVQPEFYFDPAIVNNCSLPTWAKSKFEFVYIARKKLETSDISSFIDYAFGVKINSSPNSQKEKRKLFKKEHPKRMDNLEQPKINRFPTGKFIDAAIVNLVWHESSFVLSFSIIFREPRLFRTLELAEDNATLKVKKHPLKIEMNDLIYFNSQHNIFGYSQLNSSVIYFLSSSSFATAICIPLYTEFPLFAAVDDEIIFCRDECLLCVMPLDSIVQQYKQQQQLSEMSNSVSIQIPSNDFTSQPPLEQNLSGEMTRNNSNEAFGSDSHSVNNNVVNQHLSVIKTAPYKKFWFAEAKITAVAASNIFKIAAFSTIDGFIHVHDLGNTKMISKINLSYEVKQIVITSNWGFVVASSEEMITVISVNGEQIKSFKAPFVIDKIWECSTISGFDYIAFSTFENRVGYFEAMYPERWTDLWKCDSSVVKISYDAFHRTFIVIEENGNISSVPGNITVSI